MRLPISAIQNWRTDEITAVSDAAETAAGVLGTGLDAALGAALRPGHWHGATREAALARLRQEHDHAHEVRNVLQQIADEAADAAIDLEQARRALLREVNEAIVSGCRVSDTGTVTHVRAADIEVAARLQTRIQRQLQAIDEIDETYGARLDDLRSDIASMVLRQPDVTVPGLGTTDADAMVRTLQSLTVEQRRTVLAQTSPTDLRHLIQADPQTMGNLDGVPFALRGNANEINIRNALAAEIRAHGSQSERATMLRSFLTQRAAPYSADPSSTSGNFHDNPLYADTERVFVSFTDADNPRLVEMVGALTPTTPNAAVYVPGTGTNARGFGGSNWQTAWNLAQRSGGPVLIYLDGDLPQALVNRAGLSQALANLANPFDLQSNAEDVAPALDGTALDTRYARDLAPRLVGFGQALDAELAATAPGASTTYIGHSYGGSVVGTAEQLGLRADNVIYASSAGTGIYPTEWHDPNPEVHRYSIASETDPIQAVQSLPGNPHGSDPDSAPGVTKLNFGQAGDGSYSWGFSAHGSYFDDPNSDAFKAMVDVITGERQQQPESIGDSLDAAGRAIRDAAEGFIPGINPHVAIPHFDPPRSSPDPSPP